MMARSRRPLTILAILSLAVLAVAAASADRPAEAADEPSPVREAVRTSSDAHPPLWFDEVSFAEAVRNVPASAKPGADVIGGLIPHHWIGGHLITGFFSGLPEQQPKTIILIGPNHTNSGHARILSSDWAWATPFGRVEPASDVIESLEAHGLVPMGGDVLTPEHSVAGIMPAIKYYLPEARVVPIILGSSVVVAEAEGLAAALVPHVDDKTVVVAAVDFSHFLVQEEASERDVATLDAIRSFDSAALFAMNNDYLDSPASVAVLLETMLALGSSELDLFGHTNSGLLADDELSPTTSYFAGYYYR